MRGQAQPEYERWRRVLSGEVLPAAMVDVDALDANIDTLREALGDRCTLRVASKSVRCAALVRHILERGGPRFRGVMTYSAREAAALAREGFDDLLMGYPVGRPGEARILAELSAAGKRILATVDCPEHLGLLETAAQAAGSTLDVCLDVDMSWRPLAGRLHLGVRRSPIHAVEAALELAARIGESKHLRLHAMLAYEAQVAGMADVHPGSRALDPIRRLIKARSRPAVAQRRAAVVEALRGAGHTVEVVNGGGTGSLSWTGRDPSVTEVTAGSGFLCPHLFDGYRGLHLRPAAFFALPVVRFPAPGVVTCFGGGFLASGPGAPDRAPQVYLPAGLKPLSMEGFGEVQTPLVGSTGAPALALGDPVLCRHAKAGELAEHFEHYLLVRGHEIVDRVPTYRGAYMKHSS